MTIQSYSTAVATQCTSDVCNARLHPRQSWSQVATTFKSRRSLIRLCWQWMVEAAVNADVPTEEEQCMWDLIKKGRTKTKTNHMSAPDNFPAVPLQPTTYPMPRPMRKADWARNGKKRVKRGKTWIYEVRQKNNPTANQQSAVGWPNSSGGSKDLLRESCQAAIMYVKRRSGAIMVGDWGCVSWLLVSTLVATFRIVHAGASLPKIRLYQELWEQHHPPNAARFAREHVSLPVGRSQFRKMQRHFWLWWKKFCFADKIRKKRQHSLYGQEK